MTQMVLGKNIKRNSVYAFFSHSARLLTNILVFVGIARYYGAAEFGQFTAAHTLSTVFLLIADFGFDVLLTSEVARNRSTVTSFVWKYLSAKVFFAAVATLMMIVVALLYNVSGATRDLMLVFSAYVLFSSVQNFFFALFRGFEEFQHETKISAITNLLMLACILIVGLFHLSLAYSAGVFVASRILAVAMVIVVSRKMIPLRSFRFSLPSRSQLTLVAVFGTHAIFSTLFFVQDTLLLSLWRGDREVGIYQAVFKLVTLFFVIPDVVMSAMLPVLSRYYETDKEQWNRLGCLMNKTLFLIGLPIMVLFLVFAEQLLDLVYGPGKFTEAAPVLRIFAGIALLHFSGISYALLLTTVGRQTTRMTIVFLATIFNFGLNAYFIPLYGPIGAAYVSLLTIVGVNAAYVGAMRHLFAKWVFDFRHGVPLAFSIAIVFSLWQARGVSLVYGLPLMLGLYALVFYFIGYSKEERKLMLGDSLRLLFLRPL